LPADLAAPKQLGLEILNQSLLKTKGRRGMIPLIVELAGDGAFEFLKDKSIRQQGTGTPIRVATLDQGMQSGNPSVAIAIELADGSYAVAQTSVRLFQQAAAAMTGKYGLV
jgi:hypothetical protein